MKSAIATFLAASCAASALLGQSPRTPPSPAARAQHRVDFLSRRLMLSPAQQQSALAIYTKSAAANADLEASLRAARRDLSTAVRSNATGAIGNLATQIGNLTADLTSNDAQSEAAFYQTLTPAQQAIYNQRPNRGFRGFDGRGGPGPGPGAPRQ